MAEEALLDERLERVEVGLAHLLGRLERAAAGEDGEAGEEALLFWREQVVRPVDRRAQGALALGEVARAAASGAEAAARADRAARAGGSTLTRAAASSIASGRWSSRRQISVDLAVRRELDAGRPHALVEEGDRVRLAQGKDDVLALAP